jgi:hypothetical protein
VKAKSPPSKNCKICGRTIEWRAKWAKNWTEVEYCGEKCRRNKQTLQMNFETKILELLNQRSRASSICPSEVLPAELKSDAQQMELVRQAARRLALQNKIVILQKGQKVEASDFRGPIRLKRV